MSDKPRQPPDSAAAPADSPQPAPARRVDPAADEDSPSAIPVYPPAQGDGS